MRFLTLHVPLHVWAIVPERVEGMCGNGAAEVQQCIVTAAAANPRNDDADLPWN
jgi:hypothetical protein